MQPWTQILVSVIAAVFASSGFWSFLQSRANKNDIHTQVLIGLAHDRIVYLGLQYIKRGWITHDEYENLYTYLYVPYKDMGGNGSAERVMSEVKKLPIKTSIEKE